MSKKFVRPDNIGVSIADHYGVCGESGAPAREYRCVNIYRRDTCASIVQMGPVEARWLAKALDAAADDLEALEARAAIAKAEGQS